MKALNKFTGLILLALIMTSFSQCSSVQKLQKKAPTNFGEVYCEEWVAGAFGAGSGINIYIPVADFSIKLDSAYFREKATKLNIESDNDKVYIGRILTDLNTEKRDLLINSDSKKEYGNKPPELPKKIPFELNRNECVVSYIDNYVVKYFKIENVIDKPVTSYPMAPNGL